MFGTDIIKIGFFDGIWELTCPTDSISQDHLDRVQDSHEEQEF